MIMVSRYLLSIAILIVIHIETATAQQVIAASGGIAVENDSAVTFKSGKLSGQSENGSVANGSSATFTVGQILYQTYQSDSGSAAHGVQQAYEISAIIGKEVKEIVLSAKVYPNPAGEKLYLELHEIPLVDTYYRIMDVQGRVLKRESITSPETEIHIGEFPGTSYFIQVLSAEKGIKTFQIIKK